MLYFPIFILVFLEHIYHSITNCFIFHLLINPLFIIANLHSILLQIFSCTTLYIHFSILIFTPLILPYFLIKSYHIFLLINLKIIVHLLIIHLTFKLFYIFNFHSYLFRLLIYIHTIEHQSHQKQH